MIEGFFCAVQLCMEMKLREWDVWDEVGENDE